MWGNAECFINYISRFVHLPLTMIIIFVQLKMTAKNYVASRYAMLCMDVEPWWVGSHDKLQKGDGNKRRRLWNRYAVSVTHDA